VSDVQLFTQAVDILPDLDAIREFDVDTTGMTAQYNQPSVINVITKSGSNRFHGTAYEFFRNADLNANNWFNHLAGVPVPKDNFNQFGSSPTALESGVILGSQLPEGRGKWLAIRKGVPEEADKLISAPSGKFSLRAVKYPLFRKRNHAGRQQANTRRACSSSTDHRCHDAVSGKSVRCREPRR
jgi:hypothetical protein